MIISYIARHEMQVSPREVGERFVGSLLRQGYGRALSAMRWVISFLVTAPPSSFCISRLNL